MEKNENQKIEIMMRDYELLKTYSTITSPGVRYNLISIALATISIVISGTMIAITTVNLSVFVTKIIAMVWIAFIPVFCLVVLYVWLGEEQRMMRVGEYCKGLEITINEKLGEKVLNWETFKRDKSIKYPEFLIILLFLGLSFSFPLAGLYLIKGLFIMTFIIDLVVHLVIVLVTYIFVKRKIIAIEEVK